MSTFKILTRLTTVGIAAAVAASFALSAQAQTNLSGETVEWTIPFSEKGGSAKWANFFAPLLSEALPGQPTVVVKFMPGAGSTKGERIGSRVRKTATAPFCSALRDPRSFPTFWGTRG